MGSEYCVEMKAICKSFGGIKALDKVSFCVKPGEICALVGENGAGKSTLAKILSGAYQKDTGYIYFEGQKINPKGTIAMRRAGIGIIYQEFALAPDLSVAENIFLNRLSNKKGVINWAELYKKSDEIINSLGFDFNARKPVGALSVAYQQVVEIAKALNENVKLLVLDEPTAVLSPHETLKLFKILKELKAKGVSIIYISHRLDEVFQLADTITVLRDGQVQKSLEKDKTSSQEVISLMLGRNFDAMFPERHPNIGKETLSVKGMNRGQKVKNFEISVAEGEILGIAGLVGSGKTEAARLIFGADKATSGQIYLNGERIRIRNPHDAVKKGIVYLPENRKEHGVILPMKVKENITLPAISTITKIFGFIDKKKENSIVDQLINKLKIKTNSADTPVLELSGGNQQKVSLAKWFTSKSKVIILDEPTRGVDIGAKYEIYNIVNDLTHEGKAVIFISSEIEEIIGMCDRVIVLKNGSIVGQLDKNEMSKEMILSLSVAEKTIA